jgi:hypothetical protein
MQAQRSCNLKMRQDSRGAEQLCLQGLSSLRSATNQESIPVALRSQNQTPRSKRTQPSSISFKIIGRPWWHLGTRTLGLQNWLHNQRPYYRHWCNVQSIQGPSQAVIRPQEWETKKKYLEAFLEQCWHFSPFCGNHGWLTWQGITTLAQETVSAPCWEMGETVLRDLWLCQCLDEHYHGLSHSSLFTGLPYPSMPNEQWLAAQGGHIGLFQR